MAELKGSKTEKNLQDAFAGESMARNKYTYYAAVAKKEGYEQIAALFLETAENEKEHAKLHFKALSGLGDTITNLKAAAAGEYAEWIDMYPRMAKEAREEGFTAIAAMFDGIAAIEKAHQERYKALLASIEEGTVFKEELPTSWKCRNCGHIHEATDAPDICPVCHHPKGYFERVAENY
ncbi:rubrerythrin [Geomonas subterranea]|uniref:Rubrerythrin family protein n=1 Tax=Geomonas subterranea TaxID=2847989 RepID=A0ABX8LNL3_9BACT|nr:MULTISPECIES: rubrerythrin family protein [Geomonas]QXE91838.1 rubrerythrin family protein [Geomonas subterranea]QXM10069.1 rubrerythrin family protein [Geomonas subterranea]